MAVCSCTSDPCGRFRAVSIITKRSTSLSRDSKSRKQQLALYYVGLLVVHEVMKGRSIVIMRLGHVRQSFHT